MSPDEIRKTVLVLSRNNYTPVSFWLNETLFRLSRWISANNELIKEHDKK